MRWLEHVGLWGTLLTAAILAMSVLLRLGSAPAAGGDLASTLPVAVEQAARVAHRLAAMGVGALAALALVLVARERPAPRTHLAAVVAVTFLTLLLAVMGRYTTGYRFASVTVGNVVGGITLTCAFWWLRSQARGPTEGGVAVAGWLLAALLALAAVGAAASHESLHGRAAFGTLHMVLGFVVTALALAACWRSRHRPAVATAAVALCVVQLALGAAMRVGPAVRPPLALAWSHAMAALVLCLAVVSLAAGAPRHRR